MFTILIHIFYHDSWELIFRQKLVDMAVYKPRLLVNLCQADPRKLEMAKKIKADYPEAMVIFTPNKGKDIGGKLALIDLFLKTGENAEYLVLLHDKRSPYSAVGDRWRETLLKIVKPSEVDKIIRVFEKNRNVGIVGAKELLRNESDMMQGKLVTPNEFKLRELIELYQIRVTDFTFVAGSMFWVRSSVIKSFFERNSALKCRERLESGNISDHADGTYTHSWERLFCWLGANDGLIVTGI